MLKVMPQCFEFDDHEICTLPVWVKLPGLPLDFWNPRALTKIVSKIGKPISTDKLTATKGRLLYARVLVEIDMSKKLVRSVAMNLPTGKFRVQPVEFEHEPKFCGNCKMFGHLTTACNVNKKASIKNSQLHPKMNQNQVGKTGQIDENSSNPVVSNAQAGSNVQGSANGQQVNQCD